MKRGTMRTIYFPNKTNFRMTAHRDIGQINNCIIWVYNFTNFPVITPRINLGNKLFLFKKFLIS